MEGILEGIQSAPANTRLGGHALENSLFREFNESYGLGASHGGEIFQEFLNRRTAFPMVDQGLDGYTRPAEARSAAHPLRVDPNHFVERDSLFRSHATSLTERSRLAWLRRL